MDFEILGFRNFRGKFDTLHFELALVIVEKVVVGTEVNVMVKFGDHRRWSETVARGAHAPPLWAARGGASGVLG